jgi:hypothetical protein
MTAVLGTSQKRSRNPYLPRSLHLPVASTEGSVTQNFNKIGVRLWTNPPKFGPKFWPRTVGASRSISQCWYHSVAREPYLALLASQNCRCSASNP